MRLYDAHNHLHAAPLQAAEQEVAETLEGIGLAGAVVNGTREEDWDAVAACAGRHPWARPSFGLHPWFVRARSPQWRDRLEECLRRQPEAAVGEVGLDRWMREPDPAQAAVLTEQLALASRLERPVTLHCLRAWGALEEILRRWRGRRPFLLHAYGGPAEMVRGFVRLGAYFSFSPYFLQERKAAVREVFRQLPADRVLVETDAPEMAPPPEQRQFALPGDAAGRWNHPGHVALALEKLAELRGVEAAEMAEMVESNFIRLFGQRGLREPEGPAPP